MKTNIKFNYYKSVGFSFDNKNLLPGKLYWK